MPRTKRPVAKRKVERVPESEEAARRRCLDEIVEEHKRKLESRCEMEITNIQMAFKILTKSLGEETMQKTIGQLKNELVLKERPTSNTTASRSARGVLSQDDGYLTESSAHDSVGATTARRSHRVSRSATRLDERSHMSTAPRTATGARRRSRSAEQSTCKTVRGARPTRPPSAFKPTAAYKTPAYNKNALNNFPPITPKVTPNTPLTVLRRPRQGEMVVSMSGSPLMVPTMQADNKANCNIPLYDGTMLSLQPEILRKSSTFIPFSLMDSGVLQQLKTLKQNLEKVVELGENSGRL